MPVEIERKFLVKNLDWKLNTQNKTEIKQGYLSTTPERTVRIRIADEKAWITIKGKTIHTTRKEFEYEIPHVDAIELLPMCENPLIEKTRFKVLEDGHIWEIDVFDGANKGLTIAEIELKSEAEKFQLPKWIDKEVSHDNKYFNASLIQNPFQNW